MRRPEVLTGPDKGAGDVIDRCWTGVFRCESVVHCQHRHISDPRQAPTRTVMGLQVAHDEATSVQVQHRRSQIQRWAVEPHGQTVVDAQVLDQRQFRPARPAGCPRLGRRT